MQLIQRVSLHYTKLAMLAMTAYKGKSKINLAKNVEPGTSCDPL